MLGKWKCTFNELYSLTKNDECIPENEILLKMGATSWLVQRVARDECKRIITCSHTKYCKRLGPQNMKLEK